MSERLSSGLYVKACVRAAFARGCAAAVVRRGHEEAGLVLIKLNRLDGSAEVLDPSWTDEGLRRWHTRGSEPETEADGRIEREIARDPDLWILEIEDREARHPLDEPIDGRS